MVEGAIFFFQDEIGTVDDFDCLMAAWEETIKKLTPLDGSSPYLSTNPWTQSLGLTFLVLVDHRCLDGAVSACRVAVSTANLDRV